MIVGLDNNEKPLFLVFPNPTTGAVSISTPNKIDRVHITNALGQTVVEKASTTDTNLRIDLPGQGGFYMLHVVIDGVGQTTRVIMY